MNGLGEVRLIAARSMKRPMEMPQSYDGKDRRYYYWVDRFLCLMLSGRGDEEQRLPTYLYCPPRAEIIWGCFVEKKKLGASSLKTG